MSLNALIDSGSPISSVKEHYIPRMYVNDDSSDERFCGVNGSKINVIGLVEANVIYEQKQIKIKLRIVSDETMKSAMILGRDFLKSAKLSLTSTEEVTDIMNIELDDVGSSTTAQDIQINEDLPFEVKTRGRELFDKFYVKPKRPSIPAVENVIKLSLTENRFHLGRVDFLSMKSINYELF